ncbi:uncharacterized protein LOC132952892 [Metopolophium dirhodum]|uniref:uncharacterized protein LOC132952892 n=1 Tax=Metopolophium dirhodum TaxID=44670 RepID=UPI00298F3F9C|nr:uncharacterized protein LOC132952892 [Metopolophium dirhodum]
MADRTCTLLTQPYEAASGFTSKNTLSIFENLWDEDTAVYSDCDDVDKDLNYIPFINLETSINPINIADVIIETHHNTGQINQDITLRKRRMSKNEKYTQQVKMKETQNKKQIDKHPIILKTCDGKCKKQCPLLSNEHQKEIWKNFWRLNYTDRRKYLSKCVTLVPVKRRRVSANDDINFKKHKSRFYSLTHPELKVELTICKKTFLQTLGYTNDSVITELVAAVEKDSCGQYIKENRGRSRVDIIDREVIVKHIELYHPCISHYRRHNAPNIRYLPRELTLKDMFKDFSSKYPKYCDIETYRTTLKRQNVSLNQPKADDCEDCLSFVADPDDVNQATNSVLELHKTKANKANAEYKKDSQEEDNYETRYYSMDLQKVILLPYLPNIKASYFTSRLVVFNETFATIKKGSSFMSYCVLWHEGINGRKAENITDSILKVISKEIDVTKFVFWADNCTAQNKNWTLYTALITIVNQTFGPNEIIIKYLTKGHTHMSADGIHGNIESKIRTIKNILRWVIIIPYE